MDRDNLLALINNQAHFLFICSQFIICPLRVYWELQYENTLSSFIPVSILSFLCLFVLFLYSIILIHLASFQFISSFSFPFCSPYLIEGFLINPDSSFRLLLLFQNHVCVVSSLCLLYALDGLRKVPLELACYDDTFSDQRKQVGVQSDLTPLVDVFVCRCAWPLISFSLDIFTQPKE